VAPLPAPAVKVGKTRVDGLSEAGPAPARIRAIVADAHQRELVVVAEGVRSPEQADLLIDLDCD
jgi:EAL domain-containing protein (putative c-di-GMP-specific phosphodiesterase class I)